MKYKTTILVLFCSIFLCSCLEIIEEIDLKQDGSGSLTYTLNLSQSASKINSIMLLDSINGFKIPSESEIQTNAERFRTELEQQSGIKRVNTALDFDNLIFKITIDFSSVSALNQASSYFKNKMMSSELHLNKDDHFTFNGDTFSRKGDYKGELDTEKLNTEDLSLLEKGTFTSIFRSPLEIRSSSNSRGKISKSRKAHMLKTPLNELVESPNKIGFELDFQ